VRLYFLLEGKRTEPNVYRAWLSHAFPWLREVARIEDMADNTFFLLDGGGHPRYLELVDKVLNDAAVACSGSADHLFFCVDAEEERVEDRLAEIEERIGRPKPSVRYSIIVQNCCIETWFLGNHRFLRQNPEGEKLRRFKQFYDVSKLDPEAMGAMPPYDFRAQFHLKYFKEMVKERRLVREERRKLSYSKGRGRGSPGPVVAPPFLAALVDRYETTDPSHLTSFGKLLAVWRDLGAQI
jgi:hypothetical protein